jgi:hypothetical protein
MVRKARMKPRGAQGSRAISARISVEKIYDVYARKFLGRLQKEAAFLAAKPVSKIGAKDVAGIRDRLISEGRYGKILDEVASECRAALEELSSSGRTMLMGANPGEVPARILLTGERIMTLAAMKASNFKASWDNTMKTLRGVMEASPNREKYAKLLSDPASLKKHVADAFRNSTDATDFVQRVLEHDTLAFQRGHVTKDFREVAGSGGLIQGVYERNLEFRILEGGGKPVRLWAGDALPIWENCISMKILPKEAAASLGIGKREAQSFALGNIDVSFRHLGGIDGIMARAKPRFAGRHVPFAGSIRRGVPGSEAPRKVAREVLEKLAASAPRTTKRTISKGAAAALLAVSSIIAASLLQEKKDEESRMGAVPRKMQ